MPNAGCSTRDWPDGGPRSGYRGRAGSDWCGKSCEGEDSHGESEGGVTGCGGRTGRKDPLDRRPTSELAIEDGPE